MAKNLNSVEAVSKREQRITILNNKTGWFQLMDLNLLKIKRVKNTAEAVRPNQANTSCREKGTPLPDEGRAAAEHHCCHSGGRREDGQGTEQTDRKEQ